MACSLRILCAVVLMTTVTRPVDSAPVISAPWGQISGNDAISPGGRAYSAYLAIPYALPPLGDRRFAKPVVHPGPGSGRVFNGSSQGYQCPQAVAEEQVPLLSEDCLTLNVFVPASASASGSRNVMIWIHGGGFMMGSAGEFVPSELVTENDVIVVVIQYRLGVLGFLYSGDNVVSGNYGLRDQILAMRWVKDNIRAFGGDPDSVTIFGESAGGMSVGLHLLTPYSKGLFSRAIIQSGSPLGYWALKKKPTKAFSYVANKTGCAPRLTSWADRAYYTLMGGRHQAEHQNILECLRRVDWKTLVPFTNLPVTDFGWDVLGGWAPTVDGDILPRDPMALSEDPAYLASIGATAVDVMSGMTNEEGDLSGFLEYLKDCVPVDSPNPTPEQIAVKENFFDSRNLSRLVIQTVLGFYFEELEKDPRRMEMLTDVIQFFSFPPLVKGQDPSDQDVGNIVSDGFFLASTVKFARDLAAARKVTAGRSPTGRNYLYLFNHYPAGKAGQKNFRGTSHAQDLSYEFDEIPFYPRSLFNADDYTVGSTFRSMLTNFAKTGDPQVVDRQLGQTWPQFTLEDEKYLSLEVTPRVADHLYAKRAALLLELVPSLVNSTRVQADNSWTMPWQRGQEVPITFKGRINFYKIN